VKGEIALTANEYKAAQSFGDEYWLYVVFNCASGPQVAAIRIPPGSSVFIDREKVQGAWDDCDFISPRDTSLAGASDRYHQDKASRRDAARAANGETLHIALYHKRSVQYVRAGRPVLASCSLSALTSFSLSSRQRDNTPASACCDCSEAVIA
jgi:uncharacterized protein DUF3883